MKYSLIVANILWLFSCHTMPKHFKTNPLYFDSDFCPSFQEKSLKGSWKCQDHEYFYEIGESVSSPVLTDAQKFKFAFRGSYYLKFFESIHIDPKLANLYMDSIVVEQVISKSNHRGPLLFPCSACNRVANLTFRGRKYPYPFFNNQPLESEVTSVMIDTIYGCSRVMTISKNGGQSAMFIQALQEAKVKDKIAVYTLQTLDTNLIVSTFKSIKIKF